MHMVISFLRWFGCKVAFFLVILSSFSFGFMQIWFHTSMRLYSTHWPINLRLELFQFIFECLSSDNERLKSACLNAFDCRPWRGCLSRRRVCSLVRVSRSPWYKYAALAFALIAACCRSSRLRPTFARSISSRICGSTSSARSDLYLSTVDSLTNKNIWEE